MKSVDELISDAAIERAHGFADFGPTITKRGVINEGVAKCAVGYHCGATQLAILREHGLVRSVPVMAGNPDLTKKGKEYARAMGLFDAWKAFNR